MNDEPVILLVSADSHAPQLGDDGRHAVRLLPPNEPDSGDARGSARRRERSRRASVRYRTDSDMSASMPASFSGPVTSVSVSVWRTRQPMRSSRRTNPRSPCSDREPSPGTTTRPPRERGRREEVRGRRRVGLHRVTLEARYAAGLHLEPLVAVVSKRDAERVHRLRRHLDVRLRDEVALDVDARGRARVQGATISRALKYWLLMPPAMRTRAALEAGRLDVHGRAAVAADARRPRPRG